MDVPAPLLNAADLERFFETEFPQASAGGKHHVFESVSPGLAVLRLDPEERHVRPGGTVSGPALFTLADYAAYGVILAHIGPVGMTVTTHASMDFLRKPELGPLRAAARLLKLGKRLAVVGVDITDAGGALAAHASLTYSIPPQSVPAGPA